MTHSQTAELLRNIFKGVTFKNGYIGNCSPCGTHDNRSFMIFTGIDIPSDWGGRETLSLNLPDGNVTAATLSRLVRTVIRYSNLTVSCSLAQMLNACE